MITFADVDTFLTAGLTGLGYNPVPIINPGPATNESLQKLGVQRMVFATVGNGAGVQNELVFDRPFINLRFIGNQADYTDAETLAIKVDRLLLAVDHPTMVGATRVLYITRTGGRPQLIEYDAGQRYHFSCNYITKCPSGVDK